MLEHLEWYRVFYAFAKAGSLSKAAESLYVSQPAVTHTLKQLERHLGGALFFRMPRGVKLTPEGETLLRYVEQGLGFIASGEKKMAELHRLAEGELRIGAGDTLCRHVLLPHLQRFHEAYPGIRLSVTNRTTPETLALLKEGKIDCGIVHLPVRDPRVHLRAAGAVEDCFVAGAPYRALAAAPVPLAELAAYPLLMLERGSGTRSYLDALFTRLGATLTPGIELGSIDLLVDFACAGLGIACVTKHAAARELASGALVEIPLLTPLPPLQFGVATLKDVPLSAAAQRFIAELTAKPMA